MLEYATRAGIVSEETRAVLFRSQTQTDRLAHKLDRAVANPPVRAEPMQMPDKSFIEPLHLAGRHLILVGPAALIIDDLQHSIWPQWEYFLHVAGAVVVDERVRVAPEPEMSLQGLPGLERGHVSVGAFLEKLVEWILVCAPLTARHSLIHDQRQARDGFSQDADAREDCRVRQRLLVVYRHTGISRRRKPELDPLVVIRQGQVRPPLRNLQRSVRPEHVLEDAHALCRLPAI